MSLREEFVRRAVEKGANMSALCREYHISRPTGYKWRARYLAEGAVGLADRSRRPHRSPVQTPAAMEERVLAAREAHPTWGGRKLKRHLENQGQAGVPAPSTLTAILRRHDQLDAEASAQHTAYQRFERAAPNELWQMDFKGHFPLATTQRCHPLTVLDDHSRFLVGLQACPDETHQTVQDRLTAIFRVYGLPQHLLVDNGPPWSDPYRQQPWTRLSVWLLRLGITVLRSRVRHPQTLGKDERLHRTLKQDLLDRHCLPDFPTCQQAFDQFRQSYNTQRPHEAHQLDTPAQHYQPSLRPFPPSLPPLIFPTGTTVRKVDPHGRISYRGQSYRLSKAFCGQAIGLLPDAQQPGCLHVFFNDILIRTLDIRNEQC